MLYILSIFWCLVRCYSGRYHTTLLTSRREVEVSDLVKREAGKEWTRTCMDLSPGTKLTNKQWTKNRTVRMVSTVTTTASVRGKKGENRWPQTANIAHHKKIPLNEKATRQTRSSSLPPPRLTPLCHRATAAMTVSALRLRALSLHSSATNTSSFCLFPPRLCRLLCSVLKQLNEDMLL